MKDEVVLQLANGWTLRSGSDTAGITCGEWLRLCDAKGEQVLYWHHSEWKTDPVLVMGAIMNAACRGTGSR